MAFKHPEFLWGFLLLLIPIAVHLLQFRKRKKILFPGVSRLFNALQVSQKQRNIRFWLLLTLRSLFISILVLAFAQPYIPQNSKTQSTRWIVIYDQSPSMFLTNKAGETAHQQAQNVLQEWLKSGHNQESFALVTGIGSEGWIDANQLRELLGRIEENARPRSIKELLGKAQAWYFRAKEDGFSPQILVVSDFQADFLQAQVSSELLSACSFLEVGRQKLEEEEFNLSLDSVYLNKDRTGLKAQVSLNSPQAIQVLTNVSLWANGVIKAQKSIQFSENDFQSESAGAIKEVEFNLNGLKLDSFRVALSGDQFLADNQLYGVFSPNRRQRIYVDPQFEGFKDFERVISVQPERFEWVKSEQESDWIIVQLGINDVKKYQGNSSRMVFLRGGNIPKNAPQNYSRLEPGFLETPLFEGFLKTELDDKTPLPEILVNDQWSKALLKDFDALIQTETKESVLFKNDLSDRMDFIWAASWNDGLAKVRNSVWFLPLFSQLIYGSSPSGGQLYVTENGIFDLDSKLNVSIDKTLNVSAVGDTSNAWVANIQNGEHGLGIQMGDEIQRSGFYKLTGAGVEQDFAVNLQNHEFKNSSNGGAAPNLNYWSDQGVRMIQSELDLFKNQSKEELFSWTQWLLYSALALILVESLVLFNMFRTKIVNSQKQA